MKLLVIPSWYPSKSYSNSGIFFKEQAEAFSKNNCEVTVLLIEIPYRKTKKDYKYFVKNVSNENGLCVYRYVFPVGILHRFPKCYYKFLKIISTLIYKKELEKQNFDAIHAHSFIIGGYIGVCLKKKFGLKCVITEHTSRILKKNLKAVELGVLKQCLLESDEFVCVSENLKKNVIDLTKSDKKIKVYPNMVSNIFEYQKKAAEPFLFVSVGNLQYEKRMDLVIKGFCKAFTKEDPVFLTIVGQGTEYNTLKALIEENKRQNQIKLTGALERKKVAELLQKSNVMALVSEKETFGIVYIEGLASGNVIIGAHNGGADDIINEKNGIFISEFTDESVSQAMKMVFQNYKEYNLEQISNSGKRIYGEEAFANYYLRLLMGK